MKLREFRFINTEDRYDHDFNDGFAWSRVYEYPLVLDTIQKYCIENNKDDILIHNSSWGFEGVHVTFKDKLDSLYQSEHSDIKYSHYKNTFSYDITKSPDDSLIDKYDVVINVSTLEEVAFDHIEVFNNLYNQVKPGGIIICTFDFPGLQLTRFENLFEVKIEDNKERLNGCNSKLPNKNCCNLETGYFVVEKND